MEESKHMLRVKRNIGMCYNSLGQHEKALELFRDVVKISKKLDGPNCKTVVEFCKHIAKEH